MTAPPFEPSREDKLRVLEELRQDRPGTRAAYNNIVSPEPQGRWAKPDRVTGREPFVDVPRLPASSPWAQQQPPDEMPTGYEINAMEPMGTDAEIERAYLLSTNSVGPTPSDSLAGLSPHLADDADLPPLLRSATATSLPPEAISPIAPDARVVTSPTSSTSLGSDPSASSFAEDQDLVAPPVDAETSRDGETPRAEHRRGGAALSRSWRRIG